MATSSFGADLALHIGLLRLMYNDRPNFRLRAGLPVAACARNTAKQRLSINKVARFVRRVDIRAAHA